MAVPSLTVSHQEYLKKYMSGDAVKKKKRKTQKNISSIKRSKIIDDDIDLNSMRMLEDGEVELYQMDEDAPQVAGIIDERPAELKAQEYYNAKRWKVFGSEDGVSVLDNMDKNKQYIEPNQADVDEKSKGKTNSREGKNKTIGQNINSDNSPIKIDEHPKRDKKYIRTKSKHSKSSESDISPARKNTASSNSDSDASPPRIKSGRKMSREYIKRSFKREELRDKSDSDCSLPRASNKKQVYKDERRSSPPRKIKRKGAKSDSDNSPPRERDRRKRAQDHRNERKPTKHYSSDSDKSPPRRETARKKCSEVSRRSRSRSPSQKRGKSFSYRSEKFPPDPFRKESKAKKQRNRSSDSDNSPPRKSKLTRGGRSSSDLSPERSSVKDEKLKKKVLYKPQDGFSSDEGSRSRNRKMNQTLDGKRAGLQDAKQLKQELSNLRKREDEIFSKLDASLSGVGAVAIKRDRKTGKIRDLEKEKEAQREKEAKASVVNEKYSKWGKGLKQVADAATRASEALKEMNKPLARYADDKDLDDFLKAQEREGDPMLDYIKQKQREATALVGEKPLYKGAYNPNRFNIRPGHRWDGVVRSNGYEKEWFTHQNARKAVGEEAYKWSTSDM